MTQIRDLLKQKRAENTQFAVRPAPGMKHPVTGDREEQL